MAVASALHASTCGAGGGANAGASAVNETLSETGGGAMAMAITPRAMARGANSTLPGWAGSVYRDGRSFMIQ